jgi:hypothetical protein
MRASLRCLRATVLCAVLASTIAASCSATATNVGCGWSDERRQAVVTLIEDWKARLAVAGGDAVPSEISGRYSIFTTVDESETSPGSRAMTRFSCVSRQVNVGGNRLRIRFSLFDDQASQNAFVTRNSFAAISDGVGLVRSGSLDPLSATADENTGGVVGADMYCGVGKGARCDEYLMLRQWSDCALVLVEVQYAYGDTQTRATARTSMLMATGGVVEYVRTAGLCTTSDMPVTKYRSPTK